MKTGLIDLAHRIADTNFKKRTEVVGILLRGSSVIGVRDELVDLDFDLIVRREFLEETQPTSDATCFEGIEVCWSYKSLEMIEAELHDWTRDTDLWAYSTANILYDQTGRIKNLLETYKQYPEPIRLEKMFSYFYHATAASPYNSDRAIKRQDYSTAQLFMINAMELYTALLFLINKSFIPYRKWRIRQLALLQRKPSEYKQRILKVIFNKGSHSEEMLLNKQSIVIGIMNEIKSMLLEEGVDPRKLGDDLWRYEPRYMPSI